MRLLFFVPFATLYFGASPVAALGLAGVEASEQRATTESYCEVSTRRYDLFYPESRRVYLEGIGIKRLIDAAVDATEERHGAFTKRLFFTVIDRDTFGNPTDDLIPAICRKIDLGIQIMLTPWAVNEETLRHELMHAWIIGHGFNPPPPPWLHEGFAYFEQYEDAFDERWYSLLQAEGPLQLEVLTLEPQGKLSSEELRLRHATAWALVYYCRTFEKMSTAEILVAWRENRLPDTRVAFATIEELRTTVLAEREKARVAIAAEIERISNSLKK